MRRAIGCLAGLAILSVPTFLRAQAPPLGGEQIVNAYTTGSQEEPKVSSDAAGEFNVVWESPQDGSNEGVFIERYENTGAKIGLEFQVNTFTPDNQAHPDVASDAGGNFVVVWTSYNQNGASRSIRGQRFNSNGITVSGEFRVSAEGTADDGAFPRVAMNRDGAFVVVWIDQDKDGDASGISGTLFDSSGAKVGSEFRVNTYTTGFQFGPDVAMDRFGAFIVAWISDGQDGSDIGVFAQRFDSTGSKAGPEFRVNTYTTGYQGDPAVATDPSGGFGVVWESHGQGGSLVSSFGQRFDRSGTKLGTEFPVPTSNPGGMPTVATMSPEGFVVTWHAGDGDGYGIFGQRFNRSGAKVGSEFQINSYTTGNQFLPAVASDTRGGFVATWIAEGNQDGDQRGVARRRMNLLPSAFGVDAHSATGTLSDADGVLEPGETVVVETAWQNVSNAGIALTGSGSAITGPPGGVYNLSDTAADYGTIPKGATVSCYDGSASHDCYRVSVTGARPATHWDVSFREDVSTNGGNPWTLHVGDSFTDVPRTQLFYKKIETLLHRGISSGCTTTAYCPNSPVSRSEMAIFIAKALEGDGAHVPESGMLLGGPYDCKAGGVSQFTDVAPTDSSCKHIHDIAYEQVTLGCNSGEYCPNDTVTRDAMASFIAKAIVAPGGGAAVPAKYGPDPVTGRSYFCSAGSPDLHFTDIPASFPFCKHIHYLWAKGIVDGCTPTTYCPSQPVNRDAMAKFIANAFNLHLYGP
jgi:hypothetical protein